MTFVPEARRRSARKPMPVVVTLFIDGDKADYGGKGLNMSLYGIRLQTDAPLALGQCVGLLINYSPITIAARVVWLHRTKFEREGEAGLEFLVSHASPV